MRVLSTSLHFFHRNHKGVFICLPLCWLLALTYIALRPATPTTQGTVTEPNAAASMQIIPIQLRLTENSIPLQGNHLVDVRLYGNPSNPVELFREQKFANFTDGNATFMIGESPYLGSLAIALSNPTSQVWMGISLNNGVELTPRTKLGSAPFAITVPNASISEDKIANSAVTSSKLHSGTVSSAHLSSSGFGASNSPFMNFIVAKDDYSMLMDDHYFTNSDVYEQFFVPATLSNSKVLQVNVFVTPYSASTLPQNSTLRLLCGTANPAFNFNLWNASFVMSINPLSNTMSIASGIIPVYGGSFRCMPQMPAGTTLTVFARVTGYWELASTASP